jgi:lysophospholipase L1-like esterase
VTPDIRICFVGDSFVNGTGDEATLGWAGRLCAAANRTQLVTCYNLGIRRDTSRDILNRWERECAARLPGGCDARVVFSFGVNDTTFEEGRLRVETEESCANLRAILRSASRYKLLMVGPPPIGDDEQDARIESLSLALGRVAAACDVPYIELYSQLAADRTYRREVLQHDGAHPRSGGYEKMASIIAASPAWWFHD